MPAVPAAHDAPFAHGPAASGGASTLRPAGPAPWPVRATHRWPLHERAAAQSAEANALAGAEAFTLMARAGLSVARLARALAPHAQRVLVLAGPGNNGGDGLVAARWLHLAGLQVQVWLTTPTDNFPPDAARAWREAQAAGVPMLDIGADSGLMPRGPDAAAPPTPALVIDALLGLGAQRAPAGAVDRAIGLCRAWAAAGVPVLAVDLPSGLHPDTGQPLGRPDQVLPAAATLCLLTLRPACFTGQGRDLAGQVWFDDLGCAGAAASATAWLGAPTDRPLPPHQSHKGSQGDVAVVGGAAGMTGAAWLAASAALAAGAGRVYLSLLDPAAGPLPMQRPELMARTRLCEAPADWLQARTVVAGCGGGRDIAAALPPLLAGAGRLLLDADALNAVAADPALQAQLQLRAQSGLPSLLTPHPLEAARLLDQDTATVQADRLDAARTLARRFGAVVVLKGSGSVVASPDGLTSLNPSGNASLATAGTGDVLAGWLAGQWAQAGPSLTAAGLHRLVEAAVWQHGAAADRYRAAGHTGPLLAGVLVSALVDPQWTRW